MGNNKQQTTKGGRVDKRRMQKATGSAILSLKRKKMIMDFKSTWILNHPADTVEVLETDMRTQDWKVLLFQHLSGEDANISIRDVHRWIKNHHWITIPDGVPKGVAPMEHVTEAIDAVLNPGVTVNSSFYPGPQQQQQQYHRNLPLLQSQRPVPPTSYSDLVTEDNDDEDNDQSFHTPSAYVANAFVETADVDQNENAASVLGSSDDEEEHAIDLRIDHANNPLSTVISRKRGILDRFLGTLNDITKKVRSSEQIDDNDNNASTSSAYVNATVVNTQQDDFRFSQPDEITSARPPMGNTSHDTIQQGVTTGNNTEGQQRVYFSQDHNYSQYQQPGQMPLPPPLVQAPRGPLPSLRITPGVHFQGLRHPHPTPFRVPTPSRQGPRIPHGMANQRNPAPSSAPNSDMTNTSSGQPPYVEQGKPHPVTYVLTYLVLLVFILFVMVSFLHTLKLPLGILDGREINQPSRLPPFNQTFRPPFNQDIRPPFNQDIRPPFNQDIRPPFNHTFRPSSVFHIPQTATHGIWFSPFDKVRQSQPPLYNQVLNRRFLQAQRRRQQAPGFTMSSEQTGSVPPGFCPAHHASGVEQNTSNFQGQAFAGQRFKVIRKIVDFSEPKFNNRYLTHSQKAATATLVVEAMTAVCKQIPALKPAVDYLQSLIAPMRRAWKKELLPLKYNNAQNNCISDMKHETTQEAVANTTTSNYVQVEEIGGGQE